MNVRTKEAIDALIPLVASDRPGRGASLLCRDGLFRRGVELISGAGRIAVVSGFFIPSVDAPETDGPGGAAALGRGISKVGKEVSLWTDRFCLPVLEAASEAIGGPSVKVAENGEDILSWNPDLLIFIERLGRARDGEYYNMRGRAITSTVIPLDVAIDLGKDRRIPSLAVGDGGNEAGMGALLGDLSEILPDYKGCLSVVSADVAIPVDVSDWGGYGLAALMSLAVGFWCGISGDEVEAMLKAEVESGAVDGVTLMGDLSVDGFPLEEQVKLVEAIKALFPFSR